MTRIRVLSPLGLAASDVLTVPALPVDLAGRTVGFLDNTKANFDRLAGEIGGLLRQRYGVKAVVQRKKPNASTPAPVALIAELAKECDVVFAGSAD
jgi:hypothetical protein